MWGLYIVKRSFCEGWRYGGPIIVIFPIWTTELGKKILSAGAAGSDRRKLCFPSHILSTRKSFKSSNFMEGKGTHFDDFVEAESISKASVLWKVNVKKVKEKVRS